MTADDLKGWAKKGVQAELDLIEFEFANKPSNVPDALARAQRYYELTRTLDEIDVLTVVTVDKVTTTQGV